MKNFMGKGYMCLVRGYAAYEDGDLSTSFTNLTEAATCFAQARDSTLVNWARADQIRVALDLGLDQTAADLMNQYDRDRGTVIDARLQANIGFSRARMSAKQGNTADAVATLEVALVLAKSVGDDASEAEISLMLSELYLVMNRPRQSGEALQNYIRLKDTSRERVKRVLNRDRLQGGKNLTTKPRPPPEITGSKWLLLFPILNLLVLVPLVVVAWVFIFGRKRRHAPAMADRVEPQLEPEPEPDLDPELEYNKRDLLFRRMVDLFESEGLYRMQGLTLSDVAYRLGTNDKYVSQAVNAHVGEGFIHMVNEYRIRHAKQMLNKYGRRASSRRVAVESGFGSVSSFHRVFKTHTGLTPLEWIRDPASRRTEAERSSTPV
jgi:AraC-like DNA-binding protein